MHTTNQKEPFRFESAVDRIDVRNAVGKKSRLIRLAVFVMMVFGVVIVTSRFASCVQETGATTFEKKVSSNHSEPSIKFSVRENAIDVTIADEPFTSLIYNQYAKPILFPVYAVGGIHVTRQRPMREVAGEADDHPHHKSLWFAHGDVNGVDFWVEKGQIKTRSAEVDQENNSIRIDNDWTDQDKIVCTDQTVYRFGASKLSRWIDIDVSLNATHGPLKLGDTKEGTFAVRTHPGLQLTPDPKRGVNMVFGTALNSAGDKDKAVWGKRAEWVIYHGEIEGVRVALMIMDFPKNLQHPTTWHARDYGLVAANPFGLSEFLKQPKGAGDVEIEEGGHLRFRYRVLIVRLDESGFDPVDAFRKYVDSVSEDQ
ncbi:MAG: PmoA family protein [Pirellulaceae bacterium]|nr:PmoA family protein [Pirellulaceae bacterium]